MTPIYLETARLLAQVAPLVFADDTFALKGGTAINLFVRDMPRLSVDLDLLFVEHKLNRDVALERIDSAIQQAGQRLNKHGFEVRIPGASESATKLLVRKGRVEVKIETNFVMRGTVYPVRRAGLTTKAREILLADVEIPVASNADVYGGKLVAAMDRQHPRDLFDVKELLANEGITPEIQRAFVIYLACHNRPVHEVLFPSMRDIRHDYEFNFMGMTAEHFPLDQLLEVRTEMVKYLQQNLEVQERQFLLSLVSGTPKYELLDVPHLHELPGIRWKLKNLEQLRVTNPKKFDEQKQLLEQLLSA